MQSNLEESFLGALSSATVYIPNDNCVIFFSWLHKF